MTIPNIATFDHGTFIGYPHLRQLKVIQTLQREALELTKWQLRDVNLQLPGYFCCHGSFGGNREDFLKRSNKSSDLWTYFCANFFRWYRVVDLTPIVNFTLEMTQNVGQRSKVQAFFVMVVSHVSIDSWTSIMIVEMPLLRISPIFGWLRVASLFSQILQSSSKRAVDNHQVDFKSNKVVTLTFWVVQGLVESFTFAFWIVFFFASLNFLVKSFGGFF